ncbi:MAG: class II fructose-bisphosphate aldolase [Chloroflexi bacterium]|nr:class II fructose-bisphosphate aldolase [Chloroflexota bacterium]
MPIACITDLLDRARRGGYALGYFEAWEQYSLEAALEAAEELASPAIIGFGGAVVSQAWLDGGGLEELAALAVCLAERATVPTAVLLNEVGTLDQVRRGLIAGCNAVMLACSERPLEENIALTRQIVEEAHFVGAAAEGELGLLPDAGPVTISEGARTDPEEAARFVARTGVDALAVSIGNIHVLAQGESPVDLALLARIHEATPVPLVIHGGSGFPAWAVEPAIARGVAKFNVGTCLKRAFLAGIREALASLPDPFDPHLAMGSRKAGDILGLGKARMKREIAQRIQLYGAAGRARAW